MLKLVHTADYHWEAEKLDKCQASADFIISQLQEIQPDLHVIAGDFWNRRQMLTNSSAFRPAIDCLTRMAAICPIVIIKGNNEHDAEGSIDWFNDLETVYPIYATERAETILFCKEGGFHTFGEHLFKLADAVLHLLPYPTKQYFLADKPGLSIDESNALIQDAIKKVMMGFGAVSINAKCPVVLVGHCNVLGATLSSGQSLLGQDILISKHDLALAGADYVALGHIHKEQSVGENMYYSGSIYHNNFGETEAKAFNVVEMDEHNGGHAVVQRVVIPSRPLSLHECSWSPANGWHDEREAVEGFRDWQDAELRIRMHMTKEASGLVDDKSIMDLYPGAHNYQVERIIQPEERVRSSEIVNARTLREKMGEWGKSIEKEIPAEVLEYAGQVERECSI